MDPIEHISTSQSSKGAVSFSLHDIFRVGAPLQKALAHVGGVQMLHTRLDMRGTKLRNGTYMVMSKDGHPQRIGRTPGRPGVQTRCERWCGWATADVGRVASAISMRTPLTVMEMVWHRVASRHRARRCSRPGPPCASSLGGAALDRGRRPYGAPAFCAPFR